ncbi:MAG TPA: DUF1802 family protein [Longimicrobiaceae bacterium]|jgi:hypothetical protein|nr:DUF1802 family protein [Longimicrobiaceae bacterium]
MLDANRSALKEWAAVERALADGRTALLIRKGGIHEKRGGFEVEHREFWLFPTGFHQNADELADDFRGLAGLPVPPSRDEVRLGVYAVVEEAFRVESLDALERLKGLHPLAPETIRSRFAYRNKPYLHALVLRAHVLPEPHVVPNTLDYEGCISWVQMDAELPTATARPAMLDAEFARTRAQILDRLGTEGVVRI